ncbi:MAG TPA: hypothetical protein VE398_13545 [Acidobacteriota bacterium]|nr:hypothetical protein [Acidobacteriota bacterium]
MQTKKEAGACGPPAGKSNTRRSILQRLLPRRKPCQCLPELWSTIADLLITQQQLQRNLATYQEDLAIAIAHLGELEAELWRQREVS